MLKYRVWDKADRKFVYPVLDISNDFYKTYPEERFVFDKLIYSRDNIELFENDIISIEFINSRNRSKKKWFLAIVSDHGRTNEIVDQRGDWFLSALMKRSGLDSYQGWIDNTYRTLPQIKNFDVKLGNVHENMDILIDWYLKNINKG